MTPVVLPAPRARIILAYVAVSLIWGSTYLGIRVSLEGFPPFLLGGVRFIAAGALLYAVARARGVRAPSPREWASAALAGALFFVVGNGLLNLAERSVSSGLASVLVATMPLWTTLFSRMAGEPVSRGEIAGIALGLAGVAVLELGSDLRGSGAGAALALLAPMGWALGSIATRRLPQPPPMMATAAQMLMGGVATLCVSFAAHEHMTGTPSARAIVAVVYLAVFGSLVGFSAYQYLLRHTRAAVATSYAYVNPPVALILGVTLADEHVGLTSAIGTAIVLGAVVLVSLSARAATRREASSPGFDAAPSRQ
jgi:drug/metabolite transporter (DMT)-like permease